jgi:hypothetical protein
LSFRTEHELVWNLERLRHSRLPGRESKQYGLLLEVGAALGEEFLAGVASEALGRALVEPSGSARRSS